VAEARLHDGRVAEAGQLLAGLPPPPENSPLAFKAELVRQLQRRLGDPRPEAGRPLLDFLSRHRLPLADCLSVAELLAHRRFPEDARSVLLLAQQRYPRSTLVPARLREPGPGTR
jgi:hypothetical protein